MFKGVYNTLDVMTEQLHIEFERLGYKVLIFDVNNFAESLGELAKFCESGVLAAIAFNNLGFNMELEQGKNVWDQLDIPFIDILVDHPFHYHGALINAPQKSIVVCIDRNHVNYIKRFYPNVAQSIFMPHGAYVERTSNIPWEERQIGVLYAGGLSKYLVEGIRPDSDKYKEFDAADLCESVLLSLISNPDRLTEDEIEKYLRDRGCIMDDECLREVISDMRIVESYAVSYFREKAVKCIVEAGIDVTVYGNGWNKCEWADNKHLKLQGRVPLEVIFEEMQRSKIVLNTMTWFKNGNHIRNIQGMLSDAVVVSDVSDYVIDRYKDGNEICFFRLDGMEKLPQMVQGLLDNPELSRTIAANGNMKAAAEDTWECRAEYLQEKILNML
jgi:hypothetical protein